MGQTESKLLFEDYHHKDIPYVAKETGLKTFRNNNNRHKFLIEKPIYSVQFPCSKMEAQSLINKAIKLPKEIFKARFTHYEDIDGGFCSSSMLKTIITFDYCSKNLAKKSTQLAIDLPELEAFQLMDQICNLGIKLQNHLEFFPKVQLKDIIVDDDGGLKFVNPYMYNKYIQNSLIVSIRHFYFTLLYLVIFIFQD